jgi:sRNA-binding carbon storage regulator CsrA
MVTTLSLGDKIHVDESITLTVVGVEGDLVCVEVKSSKSGAHALRVRIEGSDESDINWWKWN